MIYKPQCYPVLSEEFAHLLTLWHKGAAYCFGFRENVFRLLNSNIKNIMILLISSLKVK